MPTPIDFPLTPYNVYTYMSTKNYSANDVTLTEIEALAAGEEGLNHGRPLMKSNKGNFKCANCTGTDCGAAC